VKVRLDRAVASLSWSTWFPEARLHHLVSSRSDHVPILLELCRDKSEMRPKCIARYKIMWEREQSLPEEVLSAWIAGTQVHDLGDVARNLKKVMSCLMSWSREKFGAVSQELEKLRKGLEELAGRNNLLDKKEEEKTRQHMDELLYRGEMMWLQMSHISWLKEGDHNMKYFHCKAVARAKNNKIMRLATKDGQTTKDRKTMQAMAMSFFKNLYTVDPGVNSNEVAHLFQQCISDETNTSLCRDFSEEISDTLFLIGPLKAPGPDGFPPRFFQRNWRVLKGDVVTTVKKFFDRGQMPSSVKRTRTRNC
jgi:hypothetical protein